MADYAAVADGDWYLIGHNPITARMPPLFTDAYVADRCNP